jgi:hypothetical protein
MTDMRPAADYLTDAVRHDGWTPEREVGFLQHFADHGLVTEAARAVGMGLSGAYARRRSEAGTAFDLGWQAALFLARQCVTDQLMTRAIEGEERITIREEGRTISKSNNFRLAMSLLDRLDPAKATPEVRAVARAFDTFLLIIAGGSVAADVRGFFDARLTRDEDLLKIRNLFPLPEDSAIFPIENAGEDHKYFSIWKENVLLCNYPPPPEFEGNEYGTFGATDYFRTLSSEEEEALDAEGFDLEAAAGSHVKAAHDARRARFAIADDEGDSEGDSDSDGGYEIKSMAGLSRRMKSNVRVAERPRRSIQGNRATENLGPSPLAGEGNACAASEGEGAGAPMFDRIAQSTLAAHRSVPPLPPFGHPLPLRERDTATR